jgi:allantoicase
VARFRAHGDVDPDWSARDDDDEVRSRSQPGEVDLVAVRNGGLALACSDMFFGPMNNLILPGRADNMGGGWETRRRRGPGFDWIVLRLGAPGEIGLVEIDTNHFKGNCPHACSVEGIAAPSAPLTELVDPNAAWRGVLPEMKLQPHMRHFFRDEIVQRGPFSHVRLSIYPDGGISRLRVFGRRGPEGV